MEKCEQWQSALLIQLIETLFSSYFVKNKKTLSVNPEPLTEKIENNLYYTFNFTQNAYNENNIW